jgi:hypothetical protein
VLCGLGIDKACVMHATDGGSPPRRIGVARQDGGGTAYAVDAEAVYFLDRDHVKGTIALTRIEVAGHQKTAALASRPAPAAGRGQIAVDAGHVYWTLPGNELVLLRTAKDGSGETTELARGSYFGDLRCDGAHVYWLEGRWGRRIRRVPVGGGEVETLLESRGLAPLNIEVDDTHVYWTGSFESGPGSIRRIPKAGGVGEELGGDAVTSRFVLDMEDVIWIEREGRALRWRAKRAGTR